MNITTKERYDEMVKQASPNSSLVKDAVFSFLFGGTICTLGQLVFEVYTSLGLSEEVARMTVSFSLIMASAVLTIIGVYDRLAKHAGAGMVVPITGFANSVVSCGIEFKSEGLILGVGAKIFTVAGPVIVYGLGASVLYGIILYIMQTI